jgi:hypothetical protein
LKAFACPIQQAKQLQKVCNISSFDKYLPLGGRSCSRWNARVCITSPARPEFFLEWPAARPRSQKQGAVRNPGQLGSVPEGGKWRGAFDRLRKYTCFVTGHDFSRVISAIKSSWASAPKGCFSGFSHAICAYSAACLRHSPGLPAVSAGMRLLLPLSLRKRCHGSQWAYFVSRGLNH